MNVNSLARGLALCVVFVGLSGFAREGRAGLILPGTQAQHVAMGADPKFQANGWLAGYDQQGQFNIGGNFVLISPTTGLTVAHVADGLTTPWTSLYASFSNSIYNDPPNYIQVASWELYPGYVNDNGAGTSDDIALLHFASPVQGITPAEVYWGDLSPGTEMEFAGVGYQREWGSSTNSFSGEMWGGNALITDIGIPPLGIDENYFRTKFLLSTSANRMAPLDFYSGSAAYVDGKVVGLAAARGGGDDQSLFIRPSEYRSFIQPVPEASTFILMLTALPIIGVMIKKHRR